MIYNRWAQLLSQTRHRSHTLSLKRFDAISHATMHLIGPRDVSSTWDSTVNARYDRKCVANRSVPLTPSERCCAASHLALWTQLSRAKPVAMPPSQAGLRDRWDRMIIMEDDVTLAKNFSEKMGELWTVLDRMDALVRATC